ncbi:DNA oxidative demethylase ALKBH2 isoform X2 [Beta vulgaris subsp. vulgaris]|uniref:DNA oxidative demethylase ALKBH2 isoform X2 n=1 Tax=Beta vulgaris subsp. vulgaris TaxID=3555 RepID=UPI002036F175|nr:DNA oxidative demethylase ALKBH2 isoform X2 [Beta vulgaris subsp. vulgaris]
MCEESSSISTQISGGSENKAEGNNSTQLKSKNIIPEQQQQEEDEGGNNSIPLKLNNRITAEEGDKLLLWEWKNLKTKNSSSRIDLGNGSEVEYYPNFVEYEDAWRCFNYLNTHIPWTRPTLRVFGRDCIQPRDSCYVASDGLPKLVYSGYQPHAYSWNNFPPLNHILQAVQDAVPGSHFNSLLLNRYKGGNDYVGWHSDDELLYGPTPLIASLSFGCERPFFLKKKPPKPSHAPPVEFVMKNRVYLSVLLQCRCSSFVHPFERSANIWNLLSLFKVHAATIS